MDLSSYHGMPIRSYLMLLFLARFGVRLRGAVAGAGASFVTAVSSAAIMYWRAVCSRAAPATHMRFHSLAGMLTETFRMGMATSLPRDTHQA